MPRKTRVREHSRTNAPRVKEHVRELADDPRENVYAETAREIRQERDSDTISASIDHFAQQLYNEFTDDELQVIEVLNEYLNDPKTGPAERDLALSWAESKVPRLVERETQAQRRATKYLFGKTPSDHELELMDTAAVYTLKNFARTQQRVIHKQFNVGGGAVSVDDDKSIAWNYWVNKEGDVSMHPSNVEHGSGSGPQPVRRVHHVKGDS